MVQGYKYRNKDLAEIQNKYQTEIKTNTLRFHGKPISNELILELNTILDQIQKNFSEQYTCIFFPPFSSRFVNHDGYNFLVLEPLFDNETFISPFY